MTESKEGAAPALTKTRPWDPAEYLETPDDVIAYLEAAFEDGDPRVIAAAVGDVARSRGMTSVAAMAGLGRESLYKSLSRDGNPRFATVLNVLAAMGLRLTPLMQGREGIGPGRVGEAAWSDGFAPPHPDLIVLIKGTASALVATCDRPTVADAREWQGDGR